MRTLKTLLGALKTPLLISLVMFLLCGLVYPLAMTGLAQAAFPRQANGNLLRLPDGTPVGSELVGQSFTDPRFMRSRPSAVGYNVYSDEQARLGEYEGVGTGSDNYANSNPDLEARVAESYVEFILWNMIEQPDLLTVGDDCLLPYPHILPADALRQLPALVEATGLTEQELAQIIEDNASETIGAVSAAQAFLTYGQNGTYTAEQAQAYAEALEAGGGRVITVAKANLDILVRMDKMVTGVDLADIPADLFTASGSGLDPHISPAAAAVQIPALAMHTGLSEQTLQEIVSRNTEGRFLGIFGEEAVNVLKVNIEIATLLGLI